MDIFNNTKYSKHYIALIESRKNRPNTGYTEKHHIIPKSMGGTDDKDNLISLTAREHFIAHLLLVKAVKDPKHKIKMGLALHKLLHGNNKVYVKSARVYQLVKEIHSKAASLRNKQIWDNIPSEIRTAMRSGKNNPMYGKPKSEYNLKRISETNKGNKYRLGVKHSNDSIEKMKKNRANLNLNHKWYHNLDIKQEKLLSQPIDGWIKGRLPKGEINGR